MKRQRTIVLIAILVLASGLGWKYASQDAASLPRDADVKVQFRRDALGMGGNSPTPLETDNFNGADVSISGKIVDESPEWVVLATKTKEIWIPRRSILLVSRVLKPAS